MRKAVFAVVLASLVTAPVRAAGWDKESADVRPGAFVGARLQFSLSGKAAGRPHAALAIAPTQSRISQDGMIRTRIGEGLALNFGSDPRPSLTVAGIRADTRLEDQIDKSGISTGGWIAIGVGTVLVAGAVAAALFVDAVNDNSE